ncbi:hypothetical protein GCM10023317_96390 [Actinopolymorpha pittospori]
MVPAPEPHSDRELVGASGGPPPLQEAATQEITLLSVQINLYSLGHDGSVPPGAADLRCADKEGAAGFGRWPDSGRGDRGTVSFRGSGGFLSCPLLPEAVPRS